MKRQSHYRDQLQGEDEPRSTKMEELREGSCGGGSLLVKHVRGDSSRNFWDAQRGVFGPGRTVLCEGKESPSTKYSTFDRRKKMRKRSDFTWEEIKLAERKEFCILPGSN